MPTPDRQQTIYLHIGRGKTGTTAIQHRFGLCRDALADIGVFYPAATGGARGVGHDIFGKMMAPSSPATRHALAPMAEKSPNIPDIKQRLSGMKSPKSAGVKSTVQHECSSPIGAALVESSCSAQRRR